MLLDPGMDLTLRPMKYPDFYEQYRAAIKNTWTVEEVDLGLYPEAEEPDEADATGSDASDVEIRGDFWVIDVLDDVRDPLGVEPDTEIVYVTPDGTAVELGPAGTQDEAWFSREEGGTSGRDEGEHLLYYDLGDEQALGAGGWLAAFTGLVARNRRRYGGYVVHAGMAVLFVGIAASSSFADERDVELVAGQTTRVGGYDIEYVKPTSDLVAANNGRLERIDFGAQLRVTRDGRSTMLTTVRSYFPSARPLLGPG
jgi:hypothetical protein